MLHYTKAFYPSAIYDIKDPHQLLIPQKLLNYFGLWVNSSPVFTDSITSNSSLGPKLTKAKFFLIPWAILWLTIGPFLLIQLFGPLPLLFGETERFLEGLGYRG